MNPDQRNKTSPPPASEELYRAIFEQTSDGIFMTDAQGRCLNANRPGCHMLGYTREELLSLAGPVLPLLAALTDDPQQLTELLAGQATISQEAQLHGQEGRLRPVEITGRPPGRWSPVVADARPQRTGPGRSGFGGQPGPAHRHHRIGDGCDHLGR